MVARVESSLISVSSGSDGERVSVVGEDRPSGPDLLAFVAFEAGSVQAIAAFEVTDPPFGAGPEALQPALGAFGAGLLTAGDEHPVRDEVVIFECLVGRADVKPSVQSDLARGDPEPRQFGDRVWQERVLARVPDLGRCREDQSACATPRVLGDLRDLRHVPELVRLPELPLADRSGVRIGQRHDPVLDRLARDALLDLPADLLAPIRELLQPASRAELRFRAAPTRVASRHGGDLPA